MPYLTWLTLLPTAAGLLAGSFLFPNSASKQESIAVFLEGLKSGPREKVSLTAGGDAAVALRIIGITTALLGMVLTVVVAATSGVSAGRLSILVGAIMAIGGAAATGASFTLKRSADG